jgi:hypothetical protein
MEKVIDSFTTTMNKAIVRLYKEEREEKFNKFMLAFFACAFCLCVATTIIY